MLDRFVCVIRVPVCPRSLYGIHSAVIKKGPRRRRVEHPRTDASCDAAELANLLDPRATWRHWALMVVR